MNKEALKQELEAGMSALGQPMDESQGQALIDYLELLLEWNKVYNLTAVREAEQMVSRHLLDSLSILPYLEGDRILDVGSGAGLPGIPLSVMQPARAFVLNDCLGKRVKFLRHLVQKLGLKRVTVEHCRVEEASTEEPFLCITARAFSSLEQLVDKTTHLCAPGGCWLFMTGKEVSLEHASATIESTHRLHVPGEVAQRHVVVVRKKA
jgi:16S rRNA (guanine527-N7)-methyltransferase